MKEEKFRLESKRPDEYTLFPTNSIFVRNFSGVKENFTIGDKINIVGFMPIQLEKSESGHQTIVELYSNLSDSVHAIFLKNEFGIIYSYYIQQ
jgi:hypothetical protein